MATPVEIAAGSDAGTTTRVANTTPRRYYRRFEQIDRVMHALLMVSFVGCALTGVPLLVSDEPWAQLASRLLGGSQTAALIHRICATVMIIVFVGHVLRVLVNALRQRSLISVLWGPDSMVPQLQDARDFAAHVKWFIGRGPRPSFDRFTYWEKFDYWAVFWGMFIIGVSGLVLWFPHFFSLFLPGWIFNIAMLVHGEEALLAVGFIFTIHFFNGHVRPEKFPMDLVIFTGRISEHELKEERAAEYQRLVREGRLAVVETTPPSAPAVLFGRIVGGATVVLGIVTIVLIVYSLMF